MSEEELVKANIGLIYNTIKISKFYYSTKEEFQNLYDDGLVGLINGVRTYKSDKNIKISSYLTTCIKHEISRGVYFRTMNKRKANNNAVSLNLIAKNGTNEIIDCLEDTETNVEEQVEKKLLIEEMLERLEKTGNERAIKCVKMYFGLSGYKEHTFKEIAKEMNLSIERSRQLFLFALNKLKLWRKNDYDSV